MMQKSGTSPEVLQRLSGRLHLGKLRRHGDYLFVAPALTFIALTLLYPLAYNVYTSLHEVNISNFVSGDAPFVGLQNYRELLTRPEFYYSVGRLLIFGVGSLFFQFTIGFALALFFNRTFPGSGTLRAVVLLGWLLPIVVSANLWRWMLDGSYGLINFALQSLGLLSGSQFWLSEPSTALLSTIVANIWIGIPFNMILLLAGLQSISPALYEAAGIDGANAWQRFLHVTLPLMRPVSLTVLLLGVIFTFKVFDVIFIMTGGGPVNATNVTPIYVYELTFEFLRFGEGAAASVLLLLVPLSLSIGYLWLSRREEAA